MDCKHEQRSDERKVFRNAIKKIRRQEERKPKTGSSVVVVVKLFPSRQEYQTGLRHRSWSDTNDCKEPKSLKGFF